MFRSCEGTCKSLSRKIRDTPGRFEQLTCSKKPVGDAYIPGEVLQAKAINVQIYAKMGALETVDDLDLIGSVTDNSATAWDS